MRHSKNWLMAFLAPVVFIGAIGCEERTEQTPPEPTQAWADAPVWYDNSSLLVPPGPRAGNSTAEERAAARRKKQQQEGKGSISPAKKPDGPATTQPRQ